MTGYFLLNDFRLIHQENSSMKKTLFILIFLGTLTGMTMEKLQFPNASSIEPIPI